MRLRRVGDQAEVRVEDAGPGIAAEKLPHLFTRYYQAEDGAPGTRSGLGLGLFLTKELVTAHGGTVEVESRENEGTTFTLRFPLRM